MLLIVGLQHFPFPLPLLSLLHFSFFFSLFMYFPNDDGLILTKKMSHNNTLTAPPPRSNRKSNGSNTNATIISSSSILTASPRSSIASSTSRYTGGLTATSTFSSIDEHHSHTSTSNSSAIDFLSNSFEEFDIVDTLDFEDVDDGLIGISLHYYTVIHNISQYK